MEKHGSLCHGHFWLCLTCTKTCHLSLQQLKDPLPPPAKTVLYLLRHVKVLSDCLCFHSDSHDLLIAPRKLFNKSIKNTFCLPAPSSWLAAANWMRSLDEVCPQHLILLCQDKVHSCLCRLMRIFILLKPRYHIFRYCPVIKNKCNFQLTSVTLKWFQRLTCQANRFFWVFFPHSIFCLHVWPCLTCEAALKHHGPNDLKPLPNCLKHHRSSTLASFNLHQHNPCSIYLQCWVTPRQRPTHHITMLPKVINPRLPRAWCFSSWDLYLFSPCASRPPRRHEGPRAWTLGSQYIRTAVLTWCFCC